MKSLWLVGCALFLGSLNTYSQVPPMPPTNHLDTNQIAKWKASVLAVRKSAVIINTNKTYSKIVSYFSGQPTNMFIVEQTSFDLTNWQDVKCCKIDGVWHTNNILNTNSTQFWRILYGAKTNTILSTNVP